MSVPYVYWEAYEKPRVFYIVKKQADIRKIAALGIAEGSCKVVGIRTYMHLPDKPILAIGGADSVLQPAEEKKPEPALRQCAQSDILF